jgi:hypothetical protein
MQSRRFILQAFDPEYGHPAFETMFIVERPEELRTLLGIDAGTDPDFEGWYSLELDEVAAVTRHLGLAFDPERRETFLYRWTDAREVPYLVHTNYELVLMIEGRKQFARMGGEYYPPDRYEGEDRFDRYVAQGLLHKEVELETFAEPLRLKDGRVFEGFRTVYYTRKGEEWRIPAWKLISKASRKSGWNENFERLVGMLFGYEDWQNDWWIEDIRKRGLKWGTALLYLAVTESGLAGIEDAGYRALPRLTSSLKLVCSIWEEPDGEEPRHLMEAADAVALVRFRVKVRPFLDLVGEKQASFHELPPDRIKHLNRLIVGDIEIAMRRGGDILSNT